MRSCSLLLALLVLFGCAPQPDPAGQDISEATAVADNSTLREIYEQDQGDRSSGEIDWDVVSRRDSLRRVQVRRILAADEARTSEDYRHAAMVFQHGPDTTDARLAFELAERAVEIDSTNGGARWLMAAAWDRYQMRRGLPQWYGTQFFKDSASAPWRLYDLDTTQVTDEDRARLGVPSLAESRARVLEMNAE